MAPLRAAPRPGLRPIVPLVALCLALVQAAPGAVQAAAPVEQPARQGPQAPRFRHIGADEGLSDNIARTFLEDSAGLIWIGTSRGLNRYDGYEFVTYRHDPDDPAGISGDTINALLEDRDGTLWVGTTNGLDAFDPRTERFTHYTSRPGDPRSLSNNNARALYQDRAGVLWVGTDGGLNRFDQASGTFTVFRHEPGRAGSLSDNRVTTLLEDRSGTLWVGTDGGGLNRFDPTSGTFTAYRADGDNPRSIGSDNVWALFEDRAGTLWIGTFGGGLNRFDPASGTATAYRPIAGNPNSPADARVLSIAEDSTGALWIGTYCCGINILDPSRSQWTATAHDPAASDSLSHNRVVALYRDSSGLLWIGTEGGGINLYNPEQQAFKLYQPDPDEPNAVASATIIAVYEDTQGMLWLGTQERGLDRLDPRTGLIKHYPPDPSDPARLGFPTIYDITGDADGLIWIATYGGGLYRLDPATEVFTAYQHNPADPHSLSHDTVTAVAADASGQIWVGTYGGGLNRLDPATGVFTRYAHDPADPDSLIGDTIVRLLVDRTGTLWISTGASRPNGLDRLDPATGRFEHFRHDPGDPASLSDNAVWSVFEDRSGAIWVATFSGGLERFEPNSGTFVHVAPAARLGEERIMGVLEAPSPSAAGDLWLVRSRSLARLDRATETVQLINSGDGLPAVDFTRRPIITRRGELVLGTTSNGLLVVDPAGLAADDAPPQVVFTSFLLANRPVPIGSESALRQSIDRTDVLTLSHDDRVVTFQFAALDFRAPQLTRYRYMLEGFDRDWIEVDSSRRLVTYTNLDPGSYVLRVSAANHDAVWNEAGRTIAITVVPPWWQTLWARLLAVAVLVSTAGLVFQWRLHSLRARSRYLTHQVAERTHALNQRADQLAATASELRGSEARYRDLSERLRVSQQHYRQLVHNFPDGAVFLFDRELRLLIADGGGLRDMGYKQADLEGKLLAEAVAPDVHARLEPLYRTTLEGTAPKTVELEWNGRVFCIIPVPICDSHGQIQAGMLIAQDITERHVYETTMVRLNVQLEQRVGERTAALSQSLRALSDSQRFADELAATSPALLLVVDLLGAQLVYASREPAAFFGLNGAPSNGKQLAIPAALSHPRGLVRPAAAYAQLADGAVVEYEAEVEPGSGEPRWYAVRASVFRREGGAVAQVLIAALDISARRRMEDELRAFQRQLISVQDAERASIARELHDQIGQLLTGLNLTLAAADHSDAAKSKQLVRRAQALVSELTDDVRRMSVALRPAMLDDLGLLATLAWHAQQVEQQTGVRVTIEHHGLTADLPAETAMAAYRVVQEALTNVARHAGVAEATVRVWVAGHELHIQVGDRGQGFAGEAAPPAGSSGLHGMRERVALLGGRLTIESQPGAGTVVTARLPLGDEADPAAEHAAISNSENDSVEHNPG